MSGNHFNMLLPLGFEDLVRRGCLAQEWDAFCASLDEPCPVSVHVNDCMTVDALFADNVADVVPHCQSGYYLHSRPQFTLDPLLHVGCYYVQEANSMALSEYLAKYVPTDAVALDVCAAPGGKSIILSQHLKQHGFLVANEPIPKRANVLAENLQKWGNDNFMVTHAFPDRLAKIKAKFDLLLVDAPCSGEGMFRKEPEALRQWSMENVLQCAERQKSILADVWPLLKDGGTLIYSTCTYNHLEDEDVVDWLCNEFEARLIVMRHFYPHADKGEGLFIAVMTKGEPAGRSEPSAEPHSYLLQSVGERKVAVQKRFANVVEEVRRCVPVIVSGTEVSVVKGNKNIPCHALALSKYRHNILRQNNPIGNYVTTEISEADALKYLRGETLQADGQQKGITLITHKGQALGWGNNVGNRINNLYPQQWRIRN